MAINDTSKITEKPHSDNISADASFLITQLELNAEGKKIESLRRVLMPNMVDKLKDEGLASTEVIERLKYYGDVNIVPSDDSCFLFSSNVEKDEPVSYSVEVKDNVGNMPLVIPYKHNDKLITDIWNSTGCDATEVIVPAGMEIKQQAFYMFENLKKVKLFNGVTEIGTAAFAYCGVLESIVIPETVTIIGISAFEGCSLLKNIYLSDNVVAIEENAFKSCDNLTIICNPGSYAETYAKENGINYAYYVTPEAISQMNELIQSKVDFVEIEETDIDKCIGRYDSENGKWVTQLYKVTDFGSTMSGDMEGGFDIIGPIGIPFNEYYIYAGTIDTNDLGVSNKVFQYKISVDGIYKRTGWKSPGTLDDIHWYDWNSYVTDDSLSNYKKNDFIITIIDEREVDGEMIYGADKTFNEALNAYKEGKTLYFLVSDSDEGLNDVLISVFNITENIITGIAKGVEVNFYSTNTIAIGDYGYEKLENKSQEIDEERDYQSVDEYPSVPAVIKYVQNKTSDELNNHKVSKENTAWLESRIIENASIRTDLYKNILVDGLINATGLVDTNSNYKMTDFIDIYSYSEVRVRITSFIPFGENSERLFWWARFDKDKNYILGSRQYFKMYSINENEELYINNNVMANNLQYINTNNPYKNGMGIDISVNDYNDGTAYIVLFNLRTGDSIDMTITGVNEKTVEKLVVPNDMIPDLEAIEETCECAMTEIENIKNEGVSEYVSDLVENIAISAKAHMKDDSMCIVLYTDTHYTANDTCFPTIIAKKLAESTNASAILHLGDLAHMHTEGKDIGMKLWQKHSNILHGTKIPYLQVMGNHDDGNIYLHTVTQDYSAENYLKNSDLYHATTKQSRSSVVMGSVNGCYYYFDDEDSKTRIIVLNSHEYPWEVNDEGILMYDSNAADYNIENADPDNATLPHGVMAVYSDKQLEWVANVALNFSNKDNESEWSVIAIAHMGTSNWANLNVLFQDFKNGIKCDRFGEYYTPGYMYNYESLKSKLTNDFSIAGPRKIAFFVGDIHLDKYRLPDELGYPVVAFLNASLAKDSDIAPTKQLGAPTETAISVLIVTPSENKITELRFGAGTKYDENGNSIEYNPLTDYDNYRVFEF